MDGAIFYNLEKAGIGCVLRDHLRNPFMAASSPEKVVANLETIEVFSNPLWWSTGVHSS